MIGKSLILDYSDDRYRSYCSDLNQMYESMLLEFELWLALLDIPVEYRTTVTYKICSGHG